MGHLLDLFISGTRLFCHRLAGNILNRHVICRSGKALGMKKRAGS